MNKANPISISDAPQIQNMNLQFTPKNNKSTKPKPLSDRIYLTNKSVSTTPKQQRIALLQKKKNYSQSIRQKNLTGIKIKKKTNAIIDLRDLPSQIIKQQKQNCPGSSGKKQISIRGRIQNSLKKKGMFYANMQTISVLNFQQIQKKQQFCNQTFSDLMPLQTQQDEFSVDKKVKKMKPQKGFKICSKILNEKITAEGQEKKTKLIQVLQKQNLTFKKQLAIIRKQNTQLKKQLQVSQLNLQECQEKAKSVLQNSNIMDTSKTLIGQISFSEDNISQIMNQIQKQNNQLRSIYMAEKKVMQQVDLWKKKMAKQVSMWRQKYAKLRAQNLKMKSFRDHSFSMQISKDD